MIDRFRLSSNVAAAEDAEEASDAYDDWQPAAVDANVRRLNELAKGTSSRGGQGSSRKADSGVSSKAFVQAG
jgi:hypothetical protein